MVDVAEIVAIVMSLSIPLSIIGSFVYLRSKKLKLQQFTTEEREVLLQLKRENAALRDRLDSIETIVAEIDGSSLLGTGKSSPENAAKRIEELRRELGS